MIAISSLRDVISAGGSVVVDAKKYMSSSLKDLALLAKESGCRVYIKNANTLMTSTCIAIAHANPGNVIFDFTE